MLAHARDAMSVNKSEETSFLAGDYARNPYRQTQPRTTFAEPTPGASKQHGTLPSAAIMPLNQNEGEAEYFNSLIHRIAKEN